MYYTNRWEALLIFTFCVRAYIYSLLFFFQMNHFHTCDFFLLLFCPVSSLDCACQLVGEFIIENIIFTYTNNMHNNSILGICNNSLFFLCFERNKKKEINNNNELSKRKLKHLFWTLSFDMHIFVIWSSRYFKLIVRNEECLILCYRRLKFVSLLTFMEFPMDRQRLCLIYWPLQSIFFYFSNHFTLISIITFV